MNITETMEMKLNTPMLIPLISVKFGLIITIIIPMVYLYIQSMLMMRLFILDCIIRYMQINNIVEQYFSYIFYKKNAWQYIKYEINEAAK